MAEIRIDMDKLGARLRSDAAGSPKVIARAVYSAALRGRALMVQESPVDRGILRNAWKVIKLSDGGVELINDQPYAGVMEAGARPFKISLAGRVALTNWVLRKLAVGQMQPKNLKPFHPTAKVTRRRKTDELVAEANSIAWAISKHFEKVGMKGKRFVYQNLGKLALFMDAEVNRYLSDFFNRTAEAKE